MSIRVPGAARPRWSSGAPTRLSFFVTQWRFGHVPPWHLTWKTTFLGLSPENDMLFRTVLWGPWDKSMAGVAETALRPGGGGGGGGMTMYFTFGENDARLPSAKSTYPLPLGRSA